MEQGQLNWIANFIWGIADDVLRDLYVRGKYRDVILPMTVLRRLDAVLEPTKQAVLEMKATLDEAGIVNQDAGAAPGRRPGVLQHLEVHAARPQVPRQPAAAQGRLRGLPRRLLAERAGHPRQLRVPQPDPAPVEGRRARHADREVPRSRTINLSPNPVLNGDGSVKHPGLDNHAMGTIFEELVRRFNEENNEEAGEHWTPRDAVKLMANLIFLPIADQIESGTYLLYDGACGTGGMLTVAEETLQRARRRSTASRSPPTSTARRSTPRPTPSARPTCCSRARATRRTTSSAARSTRRSSNDAFPLARVRLHALQSALRQELEERPRAHGRQGRASRTRASSSSTPATPSTRSSPAPATARCCSWPTCSRR